MFIYLAVVRSLLRFLETRRTPSKSEIHFFDNEGNVQKIIKQPVANKCDGGVIFAHDGDSFFNWNNT